MSETDVPTTSDDEFAVDAMFASDDDFSVDDWLPPEEPPPNTLLEGEEVDLTDARIEDTDDEIYSTGDHDLDAKRAIEAIVMVSADPVAEELLAQIVEMPVHSIQRLCLDLAVSYEAEQRGFVFVKVAGGWRYQTHLQMAPHIERYVLEGQTARMSAAAMETLAIVAYKQPISRAQASAIRGVNVDGVLRTLVLRGYVEEVGRDAGPGQAVLFGTTSQFLERLGLASTKQLPPLGEFVPGAHVLEALEQTLKNDLQVPLPLGDAAEDNAAEDNAAEDDATAPNVPAEPVSEWLPLAPVIDLRGDDE